MKNTESSLPLGPMIRFAEIAGDDPEDTALLRAMAERAARYVRSFPWCRKVYDEFFSDGIGGIVAVFLFHLEVEKAPEIDWIWVLVGDLPSAYMPVDELRTPRSALEHYISGLEDWISNAESGTSRPNLMPIDVPPTTEYVEMLKSRVKTLRTVILSQF